MNSLGKLYSKSVEKEHVKLVGGTSSGQTIEVYRGAEYVEVPFVLGGQSDVIVGVEFYGRTKEQVEPAVFVPLEDLPQT